MSIFAFSHPILLWGINAGTLMHDAIGGEIGTKDGVEEIPGIICFEDLDVCLKLCLDHLMEVFEYLAGF